MARKSWDLPFRSCWVALEISTLRTSPWMEVPLKFKNGESVWLMINRRIKGLTFRPRRTSSHIFNHISYFSHHIRNGDLFLPTMNSFVRPAHNSNHSFVKAASGIFCLVLLAALPRLELSSHRLPKRSCISNYLLLHNRYNYFWSSI